VRVPILRRVASILHVSMGTSGTADSTAGDGYGTVRYSQSRAGALRKATTDREHTRYRSYGLHWIASGAPPSRAGTYGAVHGARHDRERLQLPGRVDIIGLDVRDPAALLAATRGIDLVFYLVPGNDPDSFDSKRATAKAPGISPPPRSRTGCSASSC